MKRLDNRSRMKREFHVRFCESLKGKYFGLLDFIVLFFIKINATWITLLLSFVARYFGVIFLKLAFKVRGQVVENKPVVERAEAECCEASLTWRRQARHCE